MCLWLLVSSHSLWKLQTNMVQLFIRWWLGGNTMFNSLERINPKIFLRTISSVFSFSQPTKPHVFVPTLEVVNHYLQMFSLFPWKPTYFQPCQEGFLGMINRLFQQGNRFLQRWSASFRGSWHIFGFIQQGTRFLQRWSALVTCWPTWQCLPLWSYCPKLFTLVWLSMVQVWALVTEMDFPPKLCLKCGGSRFGNCGLRCHLSPAFYPLALRRERFNWATEDMWAPPRRRWWRQVWLRPDKGTRAESCLGWDTGNWR